MKKSILVTGCAGFIGYHVVNKLITISKFNIIGIDNINNYYDVSLKRSRLRKLSNNKNFKFFKLDINNKKKISHLCKQYNIKYIINLAAQAGVRYSIENPKTYFDSNLKGFFNILEISREIKIKHLITASSSSVYGNQKKFPIKEESNTDCPLSFYAATKKSNEIMSYSYSNIYKLPITCLRIFTAYGPYGRPDMALFKFTKNIYEKSKINIYNKGNHERDFTHIDFVVDAIIGLINKPSKNKIPFDIYNLASSRPQKINHFIRLIEDGLGTKAKKNFLPIQKGDVIKTFASNSKLMNVLKIKNNFSLKKGIKQFLDWYLVYFKN